MDYPETEMFSNKYYELKEMISLLNTGKHLTFFHLNISSVTFHFEEFSPLFYENMLSFDFVGIRESHLKPSKNPINSIQLSGYNTEFKPTESSNGETLLYIKKRHELRTLKRPSNVQIKAIRIYI